MNTRRIIIAGGSGFIGRYLVPHFLNKGDQVTVIGRSSAKINQTFHHNVTALTWEQLTQENTAALSQTDLIINLTGATIGSKRWSESRKREILHSRLHATELLSKLCAKCGESAPALFNASAVGVYGLQEESPTGLPSAFDENSFVDFEQPSDFLSTVARRWEQATWPASHAGVRVVLMRFGVVMGRNGGALSQIKLPYYFGLGGKIGSGRQPFSWVCEVDLARAIDFIYAHTGLSGAVNVVAPLCVTQANFSKALGKVLHKPTFMHIPGFALKLLLGEMADELLLRGQHVMPKRLLDSGFQFQYPDIQSALHYALKT